MSEKEKYGFAGAGDERAGPDRPGAEFYKLKNYCLLWIPDDKFVTGPHLAERLADVYKTAKPFLDYTNRAITFSREEQKEYFSSLTE